MLNCYGLDAHYFKEKLSLIVRDINSYTPEELKRELEKLVNVLDRGEVNKHTEDELPTRYSTVAYMDVLAFSDLEHEMYCNKIENVLGGLSFVNSVECGEV